MSPALFSPYCFREANFINVECLVLLWDVSRHPVFTNTPKLRRRDETWEEESSDDESERTRCWKERLLDCPEYKEVIEDEFMASDIQCKPIQECNKDVNRFINECAVDTNIRQVGDTDLNRLVEMSHIHLTGMGSSMEHSKEHCLHKKRH